MTRKPTLNRFQNFKPNISFSCRPKSTLFYVIMTFDYSAFNKEMNIRSSAAIWDRCPLPCAAVVPQARHYHPNFFSVRPEKMCLYPDSLSQWLSLREVSAPRGSGCTVGGRGGFIRCPPPSFSPPPPLGGLYYPDWEEEGEWLFSN